MKTLLIVEDEKMIRQGIAVMARRCKVETEEIIECRNGIEAMEVLENREIDVMFTDIRMPKMDGIELVKNAENLEHCPKIVVISGYDDFNYAVEMLKHGVQDYILKPVKREKIEEILEKLNIRIEEEKKHAGADRQTFSRQLMFYLENPQISDRDREAVKNKFEQYMGKDAYYVIAAGRMEEGEKRQRGTLLLEKEGRCLIFCSVKGEEAKREMIQKGGCVGISGRHTSFSESLRACEEAMKARIHAFLCNLPYCEQPAEVSGEKLPEDFVSHFVQQFPTERLEEAVTSFQNLFFQAQHGKRDEKDMIHTAFTLQKELELAYGKCLPKEKGMIFQREHPLAWRCAGEYLEDFVVWIKEARACLDEVYDSNQNRSRIRDAVRYVEENFQKDVNMAMVSNHVSMNYSLFSIAFKEYTGVNFVHYLKNLRIEEAKRLLETTDEKIQDIGRAAGFENDKNFLKSFKAACGISPTEYRRNVTMRK